MLTSFVVVVVTFVCARAHVSIFIHMYVLMCVEVDVSVFMLGSFLIYLC